MFGESFPILDAFLMYMGTIKGRSNQTLYAYYIDLHLLFVYLVKKKKTVKSIKKIDEKFLKLVSYNDLIAFLYYMSFYKKNSSKTQARKVSSIRSFFRYLFVQHIINENPADMLSIPSLPQSLPKHLTLNDCDKLLSSVQGKHAARDYCIITLFLNCGMRLSELVQINVTDISSDNTLILRGKGNKERIVYLNQMCIDAINDYQEAKKFEFLIKRYDVRPLFLGRTGKRLGKKRIEDIIDFYLERCGLKENGISVHKLRHTAATLMYQSGTDIRTLKEILGHANIGTTQIYTHVSDQQLKNAILQNPVAKIKKKG